MMLLRNVQASDLDAIYQLAKNSGIGITTLPKNLELLEKRIRWANISFKKKIKNPHNEYYFFVLIDLKTNTLVGTSAIETCIGQEAPFYSYKLVKRTHVSPALNIRTDYEILVLANDKQGSNELCTLYLEPAYRHSSNGLLLSRARFLFIAEFRARFSSMTIAEMRGVADEKGRSPFWNAIGKHFFHMSFAEADVLTLSTGKQFISDLMPKTPLYSKLLPKKVQSIIGKPHDSTMTAMKILMQEGFKYEKYVDIFDGGPTLESPVDAIYSVARSQSFQVKNVSDDVSSKNYIIAKPSLNFRATTSQGIFNAKKSSCVLSKEAADILQLKVGDLVRAIPLKITDTFEYYE